MKVKHKNLMVIIVAFVINLCPCIVHAELLVLLEFGLGNGIDSYGSNHGTFSGDPDWILGPNGGAIHLDGLDDLIYCRIPFSLADHVTVAAWIKTDDSGDEVEHYYMRGGDSFVLRQDQSNNLEFLVHIGMDWKTAQFPIDSSFNNAWHHLAGL